MRAHHRSYTYVVQATATGPHTNLVQLSKSDSNSTNNGASAIIPILGTCSDPFGNGTKLPCPPGTTLNGLPNAPVSNASAFASVCCVSAALVGWLWECVSVGRTWAAGVPGSCALGMPSLPGVARPATRHGCLRSCMPVLLQQTNYDVGITKTVAPASGPVGSTFTYTVTM